MTLLLVAAPALLRGAVLAALFGSPTVPRSAAQPAAQPPRGAELPRGTIRGEVIDAATAAPLAGATVALVPAQAGVLGRERDAAFVGATRSTTTGPLGVYQFADLPPGTYQLRVQRIGYRAVTVDVQLRGVAESRVSVGLSVAPVRLQALTVREPAAQPYGRHAAEGARPGAGDVARVAAARARQQQFAATDVRELTHPDVREGVTLAETDLFRALDRLPGVTTRDDYTAELWTRGGRGDHTRVLFDGLPLFDPYHAFGAFSAVDADAVGAAFLHPGVRPAALGEGGAGVVELHSRAGGGEGEVRGLGELSLVSARAALDRRSRDGRTAWMVAGRRTYVDWLTAAVERAGVQDAHLPFHFGDLVARVDRRLAGDRTLEASALLSRDAQTGDAADIAQGSRAAWGNAAARVTLASTLGSPLGVLRVRHTLGASRFAARIDTVAPDSALAARYSAPPELPLRAGVLHATLAGELEPDGSNGGSGARPAWRAGYAAVTERVRFDGVADQLFTDDELSTERVTRHARSTRLALWGERVWAPAARLELTTGLRLDVGAPVANGGAVRPAPRLQVRYALDRATTLSAGIGRAWQYTQALGRPERGAGSVLYPTRLWMLAGHDTPALRTDVATVGAERWLGGDWLASANAYARRAGGVLLPDPRPGERADRPLAVAGGERAHGVELGVRKLTGRATGSLGYSWGVARMEAAGLRFPSAQDRRHGVDATLMLRPARSFALGAAYRYGSAIPYTRTSPGSGRLDASGRVVWDEPPRSEAPNALRARAYSSVDLLVDWTFAVRGARVASYVQLRNALGRRNDAIYIGYEDCVYGDVVASYCTPQDRFERGLPTLPVLGFRLAF